MTPLLQQAFAEASKLPEAEQDALASRLLAELKDCATRVPGWSAGYFENVIGSIHDDTDDTFERLPQDDFEQALVEAADELFRELDAREAADGKTPN
jgi:hypothetical protein